VVGSIQFDAAWSPVVAAAKAKGNDVAGHVNVFIFPSLAAGNIGYKAVQRTSGALAIGPVLQGLNKPVNDLSRGANVDDIINTVALTAIEAQ
jgi:phosphate acetyltransferase